jgi:hypothetical protein
MRQTVFIALAVMLGGGTFATTAGAEPLKIGLTLSNPQQLRIDFPLVGAEKHFGLFVKREGVLAQGSTWAGAKVQEVGFHDIFPGDRAWGTGYITFTLPNGDQVSMKHEFAASFLPTPDGKMAPVDHGVWTIIGGTGGLARIRGVGRYQFKPAPDDANARVWDLTGDIGVMAK